MHILTLLEKFLKKNKINLEDFDGIRVENTGEGFSVVRGRVTVANALAYALNIPIIPTNGKALRKRNIRVVEPVYDKPPTITLKSPQ